MPIISCGPFAQSRDEEKNARSDGNGGAVRILEAKSALHVILYQPEIPQNTGNVARTCAATHTPLHLIEPLGFRLSDRYLKRAGLDYWPHVSLKIHSSFEAMRREMAPSRMVYFSAHASRPYFDFHFLPGDCLVFGSETRGLPHEVHDFDADQIVQIPIDRSRVRSLNLATSVGAALFEALRQLARFSQEPVFSSLPGVGERSRPRGGVTSSNNS
jgi:tRNA (cytidine/uridine-2'-O-)-methyltransferase